MHRDFCTEIRIYFTVSFIHRENSSSHEIKRHVARRVARFDVDGRSSLELGSTFIESDNERRVHVNVINSKHPSVHSPRQLPAESERRRVARSIVGKAEGQDTFDRASPSQICEALFALRRSDERRRRRGHSRTQFRVIVLRWKALCVDDDLSQIYVFSKKRSGVNAGMNGPSRPVHPDESAIRLAGFGGHRGALHSLRVFGRGHTQQTGVLVARTATIR